MRRQIGPCALALVASLVICAATAGATLPTAWAAHVSLGPHGTALLRALNHIRAQHRLPTLSADARMDRGARAYSRVLAREGTFSHGAWLSRVARAARQSRDIGEVLGWIEPMSARAEASWAVRAWLHSPEHRRVLLDGSFRRVGIGRAVGNEGGHWAAVYTVDFAGGR